jgi:hypothetical protein
MLCVTYKPLCCVSLAQFHYVECGGINLLRHDHKSDATIWRVSQESSITLLDSSFTLLEAPFFMFIVLASLSIGTYDHS